MSLPCCACVLHVLCGTFLNKVAVKKLNLNYPKKAGGFLILDSQVPRPATQ